MSTFNLLIILFFMLLFGVRLFMYCVNIEMPRVSEMITLAVMLMLPKESGLRQQVAELAGKATAGIRAMMLNR